MRQGLTIVGRNFRTRFGEIDLIARDGSTLVFVEVRLRTSSRFGGAAESITTAKRARLVAAAREYLGPTRSASIGVATSSMSNDSARTLLEFGRND
jgi:putative endonuclease